MLIPGRKLVQNGWSPTLLRAKVPWFGIPFCSAVINVSSIAVLYWLAFSISYVVWTHPSAEPSCLCPAGSRLRLANPPFLEVIKSKHGDILLLPESSTNDDCCWNAEKMVNQTESYRLFNNAISLCSQFFGAYDESIFNDTWKKVGIGWLTPKSRVSWNVTSITVL